jgi:glycosyltransferase involved in cell wall biosynthesis
VEALGMSGRRSVDVVIPVLNEAHVLERSVSTLRTYLHDNLPYEWRIVIVDNGSSDGTGAVAIRLCQRHPDVVFRSLAEKGRGRALRHAWLESTADAVCYMDVDLSTELRFLNAVLEAVLEQGNDLATGSRLLPESRTRRSPFREILSRIYNWLVRAALRTHFSDAQCGFKAISRDAAQRLVPQVLDESWFFDTELLTLAEKQGFGIADIAVVWNEDDDSRVRILQTAWDDIKGIWRVRRMLRNRRTASAAFSAGRRA